MTQPNQSELDAELLKLQAEFDMDEYGTVNENGVYLMKRVRQLITQQTTAARIDEIDWCRNEVENDIPINVYDKLSERLAQLQKGDKGKGGEIV